ncbi:bifunctional UDP-N-acetylglucosamine diphosphorylase/glucosamine-1-phosphate N-acetyltransferase GlmU [Pseudoruegeria sp. SK021]|uniref:bifunctional UDP-N-acetylglucosamine diphosphorylase/glucosamine-1-phosphate N-acetyltransferase GlmU n=1 Tax=Pseudoruegeria sp. SK021 TaxID=1933035 RepID=UPI000A238DBB|nr:bifunctional UDP-N-acetylglucosamine diphosphorylase/glucosamine-1-phosphate N-acetyltransferase GlmU [Pseudoruegeria sp. SK021]OSP54613.1 UDP-N-acetylglucosamine diphosphorylase/glucosamine-1-phosphate N-acetyltransferase [Pseudoruegeria sp. SK021]
MTERRTSLIVLAAGMGSRMASDLPKVLHPVGGLPLLAHALESGKALSPEVVVVVTGHGAAEVAAAAQAHCPGAEIVHQAEQRGTAHAVAQAKDALAGFEGDAIVLYGDTPFISPDTLCAMADARAAGADLVNLGFIAADPGRYGRLIVVDGRLDRIVEFKDATEDERRTTLCNSGVVMAPASLLFDLISQVSDDNAAGEFYLTDIVGLANARGLHCAAVTCDEAETLGINTRAELARAEAVFQTRRRSEMMAAGVTLIAPETVFFAADTVIGRDTVIEPNVIFGPGVWIDGQVRIRAFSHLEGARVGRGASVGPYARLRPGAELAEQSHIGNFVEVKNAQIGQGAKANHLTYIGDATVGPGSNIGAGTITCNYDGVMKHRTTIGARAFVGSNTLLVAPVSVGDDALTAAGSVIVTDVPNGALAVARAKQAIKPGLAIRLRDRLRALKSAQKGN